MNSYIVRVYRQEKDNPRKVVGVVEEVGVEVKGKRAFTDIDDLWEILCAQKGGAAGTRNPRKNAPARCGTDR